MQANERYMHGHHESVLRTHSWRTVENSADYLAPHLKAGLSVLDVGSGPGTITVDIAARVAPGAVVGLDMEPTMEDTARGLAQSLGRTNVTFATGSAYEIDAPDDSYDIVHAHQVLQHVADPAAVLREMHRVVKPGGLVAARDVIYIASSWYPELPGLQKWMDVYQAVAASTGGDPNAGRRLKALALEVGFAQVESTASIWCFSSDADRDWWGQSWAERARESSFAPQAIESGAATAEDLREIAAAWRQWADDERGWFAMPHGEILARK